MGKLFGTDGIRGEANKYPMDAKMAFSVGQALTRVLKEEGLEGNVVVGKDTRISGYMLEGALEAGITSMGGSVQITGVLPTPGIAYITESMRADAGIVISASHNPFQDNGLKIFSGDGYKLSDEEEARIEELILDNELESMVPHPREMGRARRLIDAIGRYVVFLKSTFPRELSMHGFKVVLDVANGATYQVAPAVFRELGAELLVIHDEPDGFNINDNCGSQHTQDLRVKVLETGAQLGLAFDGDGDRLIAVDEHGQEITGDQILMICANQLKKEGRLANDLLVTTVMSNLGLRIACEEAGFHHHASKVGDRYVLEDMKRLGAVIGGEDSGHMIFLDRHTTGDGIVAALQLVAAMLRSGLPLSKLATQMDVYPQKLINVDVTSKPPVESLPELVEAIARVEEELHGKGRVLVRYSGTQNMCRVMVEGPTVESTERYAAEVADIVRRLIG
ncbi:MAG: phosphoglucosamine mutase [Propionibacteriaceae bacterium]|nr:phosphoglucosamine mutase [Propionibacteriaceae bacterium]